MQQRGVVRGALGQSDTGQGEGHGGWRVTRGCREKAALAWALEDGQEITSQKGKEGAFQGGQWRGMVQDKGMA